MNSETQSPEIIDLEVGEQINPVLENPNKVAVNFDRVSRALNYLGKIVSASYSVGCGVNAAAGLATLMSPGPLFYATAGVLGVSSAYANYRMTNHDVSNIFVGGIRGIFLKKIVVETDDDITSTGKNSKYISHPKKLLLSGGIFLSLSFGAVFGALTYGSTVALPESLSFLDAISVALPAVGIYLGIDTFLCLSALMTKAFSDLIKTENLKARAIELFKHFTMFDPVRDAGKSNLRFVTERILVGLAAMAMAGGIFAIVIWGVLNTLINCSHAFTKILAGVSNASLSVLNPISNVFACGFGLGAQIPFILKTSVMPVIKLFSRKERNEEVALVKRTWVAKFRFGFLLTASVLSSVAAGVVALANKPIELMPVLAGIGAFINGVLGNVVNATLSEPIEVAIPIEPSNSPISSTRIINKHIVSTETSQQRDLREALMVDGSLLPEQDELALEIKEEQHTPHEEQGDERIQTPRRKF